MTLDIILQEIYTGSINIRVHHVIFLSLSPPVPYLATLHLSLHRIGCKHIPSYFAFPIGSLIIIWFCMQPIKGQSEQNDCCLMSTYPQRDVSNHPASLWISCGQHYEFCCHCQLSRLKLSLQIGSYSNSSQCWVGNDSIYWLILI